MKNYWLDKKVVSRKLTLAKVTSNTDLFKMGRVMTDKQEMLWPLSSSSGETHVPPVGEDVLVVDDKYYMGNTLPEMTPDEENEVSMQGWVELPSLPIEDPRKTGLKNGLRQLTIEQLQRVLDYPGEMVLDTFNYEGGKFCPLAVALELDKTTENPTHDKVFGKLTELGYKVYNTRGIDGEFYTTNRLDDLTEAAKEVLYEKKIKDSQEFWDEFEISQYTHRVGAVKSCTQKVQAAIGTATTSGCIVSVIKPKGATCTKTGRVFFDVRRRDQCLKPTAQRIICTRLSTWTVMGRLHKSSKTMNSVMWAIWSDSL